MSYWTAFLYWDHLITLDAEIRYLWRRPKSSGAFLFFGVRYGALLGNIPVTVFSFVNLSPPSASKCSFPVHDYIDFTFCRPSHSLRLAQAIMVQRMYALYSGDKRILWSLIATMTLLMVIILWLVQNEHSYFMVPVLSGCHPTMPRESCGSTEQYPPPTDRTADGHCFRYGGRVGRTLRIRYDHIRANDIQRVRDAAEDGFGCAYGHGAMALANLANITTFVSLPLIPGTLATFATCISATMASRLVLNIHKQVDVNKGDDGDAEGNVPGRNLSIPGLYETAPNPEGHEGRAATECSTGARPMESGRVKGTSRDLPV
ncbi:hypothetical protein B0H11DRAFT_1921704 [Mycena galericulata]|nr:hypothetical protein B0H11DRAFT_1921704 [Mycena galericulata]